MNTKTISAFLFTKNTRGGIATFIDQIQQIAKSQINLQFNFYLKNDLQIKSNATVLNESYPIHTYPTIYKLFFFIQSIRKTYKIINEKRPDIIISVDLYSFFILGLIKVFTNASSKFVVIVNNNISYLINDKPFFIYRFILHSLFSLLINSTDTIICVSKGLEEDIIQKYNIPKSKATTIYNGIDIEKTTKMMDIPIPHHRESFFKDHHTLISYGRFDKQKDFITIIKAVERLQKYYPHIHLIIFGDGEDKQKIMQYVNKTSIRNCITVSPWEHNIYRYLKKADIMIFSSRYEGFGISILEAMACGIPVIATDSPYGPREIIGHDEYGLLVPRMNPKQMEKAVSKLLHDPQFTKKLIKKAYKRVNQFDYKIFNNQFQTLFMKLRQPEADL